MSDVLDEGSVIAIRKEKLLQWREEGKAFPNDFRRDSVAGLLHAHYDAKDSAELEAHPIRVSVAGRMMLQRLMGKASFATLQDMSGRMQLYISAEAITQSVYDQFKTWDLGDILGAEGVLFKTKTGELSVKVDSIRLLTKSVRPLPDKHHGVTDVEIRYRQRYLDLIMNDESRRTFVLRSKLIEIMRQFLLSRDYLEVETPMMQQIPGGAAAKPFVTHHNALDMALYLRISPELYLKRLVVGGFERVFEINRNFRNEGLSARHNPEFTMIEFYQAYADYRDLMAMTEDMFRHIAHELLGTAQLSYQTQVLDFDQPFTRLSVRDSILKYNPEITPVMVDDREALAQFAKDMKLSIRDSFGLGKVQIEIFEATVEEKLLSPTFITEYPAEVSPLARPNDQNPFVTDRFELFIGGREIANGFSELNDPEDQAERFRQQVLEKEAGDEEAMFYDEDYITALEHGLPPTAGEGIGIDRLVMLFTDSPSIRDVVLFPHMRGKSV